MVSLFFYIIFSKPTSSKVTSIYTWRTIFIYIYIYIYIYPGTWTLVTRPNIGTHRPCTVTRLHVLVTILLKTDHVLHSKGALSFPS